MSTEIKTTSELRIPRMITGMVGGLMILATIPAPLFKVTIRGKIATSSIWDYPILNMVFIAVALSCFLYVWQKKFRLLWSVGLFLCIAWIFSAFIYIDAFRQGMKEGILQKNQNIRADEVYIESSWAGVVLGTAALIVFAAARTSIWKKEDETSVAAKQITPVAGTIAAGESPPE